MKEERLPRPPYNPGVRDLVEQKRASARPLPQEAVHGGFAGWCENGYLPHRDEPGLVQFVTFHLADAFATELRSEWEAFLKVEDNPQRLKELEKYLDKGRGECHLKRPNIAEVVENAFHFFHRQRYELRAWVVMPNHVHVLFRTKDVSMAKVIESWKSFTAKEANKMLGRTGAFWQKSYWDTYMRDAEHEARTRRYIENNPVNARLVRAPRDWPFSSARFRDRNEILCLP